MELTRITQGDVDIAREEVERIRKALILARVRRRRMCLAAVFVSVLTFYFGYQSYHGWHQGSIDIPGTVSNSIGMKFVPIPAGEFWMGSNNDEQNERPRHKVRISRPFYLGKYEVTQAQWKAVMGDKPSQFQGDPQRPVERVSWEHIQEFIGKLNAREGVTIYRLPSEAEWEYASRAGSTTAYSFGDSPRQLGEYAWYGEIYKGETRPVGQKKPNAWGLYDMYGNIWEWVQDWYGAYPGEEQTDPKGPIVGQERVVRGCSWFSDSKLCRSAYRSSAPPGNLNGDHGFRLLKSLP